MPFTAKKLKAIRTHSLEHLGDSVVDLAKFVEDEFAQVATSLQDTEPDRIWRSPPPRPRPGTTVYADGEFWDPGYGEGPYYYDSALTWQPLMNVGGGTNTGEYRMNNNTSPPPPTGDVCFNNFATQSAATIVYLHKTTDTGIDATHILTARLKKGTRILVQDKNDSTRYTLFRLTADATFTNPYFTIPVVMIQAGANIPNNDLVVVTVSSPSSGLAPSFVMNMQMFTASGTYTPSAGLLYAFIECVGGGGGGGGVVGNATTVNGAGGGGGGAYAHTLASAAAIGASQTVTVGAGGAGGAVGNNPGGTGGDTSVGALCIAKGGLGGSGVNAAGNYGTGGSGGAASGGTGDTNISGQHGGMGFYAAGGTGSNVSTGRGGDSGRAWGMGGVTATPASGGTSAGTTGSLYGGGGGGGMYMAVAANQGGGAGAAGFVHIVEFCSQ